MFNISLFIYLMWHELTIVTRHEYLISNRESEATSFDRDCISQRSRRRLIRQPAR